jgi:hypothetical protein
MGFLKGEDNELALLCLLHAGFVMRLEAGEGRQRDLLLPRILPHTQGAVNPRSWFAYIGWLAYNILDHDNLREVHAGKWFVGRASEGTHSYHVLGCSKDKRLQRALRSK